MIKINLLPYHEKAKKESMARQIVLGAGAFILLIALLAGTAFYFQSSVSDLEKKIADAQQNLKVLDAKVGDLDKYKARKAEMELKLGVIATLEENRLAPVKMLDDLSLLVPSKSIWLTKISQNEDTLTIEGVGCDNIVAAEFMKIIENFSPIQSVDLVSSKKMAIDETILQQFIFSCKMKKGF